MHEKGLLAGKLQEEGRLDHKREIIIHPFFLIKFHLIFTTHYPVHRKGLLAGKLQEEGRLEHKREVS